uniref:Homeobox domain-containing protein n=1 Tax=Terrapene triunguis TaxID=2587831 RepID=A0A674IN92_9SAUR
MSAHLAGPPYQPYPSGTGMGYREFYWNSAGDTERKNGKEREGGMKKAKIHTAFSKEQLQSLHQRFQSQKYLSPQQIQELAAVLGLTYKMKLKRCQKYNLWLEWAQCLTQTGFQPSRYLEVHPKFHQSYPISAAGNIQAVGNPRQNYSAGQNPYAFIANGGGGPSAKVEPPVASNRQWDSLPSTK